MSAPRKPKPGKARKAKSPGKAAAAPALDHRSLRSTQAPSKRDGAALEPLLHLLCAWQLAWIMDRSRFKKLRKSRRIGGTWIQALEDVLDAAETSELDVWFTSADQSAGNEYIGYVKMWCEVLPLLIQIADVSEIPEANLVDQVEFEDPEQLELASEDEATAVVVRFHNGSRITALSSSPSRLRSKGGKLVIDEFAHHKRDRDLWKAGQPVALRGHSIRILSTPNGKSCLFAKLGERKEDKGIWSVHNVTLTQALSEGMLDQIKGRHTTDAEREEFRRECESSCASHEDYLEEYEGQEQDEAHAFLPYSLIESVEREGILGLHLAKGPLYLGMDIARRRDLSVIYVQELCGMVLHTRVKIEMAKTRFKIQKETLWPLLSHPLMVRACIDATGIGAQLAEEAMEEFGRYKVEEVTFTGAIKDALATRLKQEFEDSATLIPVDKSQREGLHAVHRVVSLTNSVRYDAKHDEENGHGDHFWALALAVSAARTSDDGPIDPVSSPPRSETLSSMGGEAFGSFSHSSLSAWAKS